MLYLTHSEGPSVKVCPQADGARLRLEREAMEGFVSPESHSNVRKQLMDLQVGVVLCSVV